MPHQSHPASRPPASRHPVSRRAVLGSTAAALVGLTVTPSARAAALSLTAARAVTTAGTTLEAAAAPAGATGYRRLTAGPGYPLVVREELATARPGRDERRTGRLAFAHLTDLHMLDAQSPVRFEWLTLVNGSAFRPHEALGTQGGVSLVRRLNAITAAPWTGLPLSCAVSTGDNTDNHEHVELDWFIRVLSGGEITPNTGAATRWEGVQASGDKRYYNPELPVVDRYKAAGFPQLPGFLDRAMATHSSPGLSMPWYAVFGNHDDSISGVLPSASPLAAAYTGSLKLNGFPDPEAAAALQKAVTHPGVAAPAAADTRPTSSWRVTPDARRAPFTPQQFMAAHLRADATGPGPVGHGFTQDAVDSGRGYYTFPLAPGITGISLDSTNRAGWTDGSIDDVQWRWLADVLTRGSSRYDDWAGVERRHQVQDELFVLFSHHTSGTMGNLALPLDGTGIRHAGVELVAMLKHYPNVLAWVNGHTHANKITAQRGRTPAHSFWEINTASHIDFPQHARLIEVADNADGTLSIFTTLVESDAPYQASYTDGSPQALASVYREMSFNDLHADLGQLGTPADRNTELLLVNPLA
ncbi:TIGR03767 family metallophosphoesterase [Arsenicicoccus dermatophilus]|uniref:TIGR03767 family metallophosphoesterase n=1 Tax=Arsenicicoccus dermatophilus TaxID=1076331 RepID=UPI0039173518